MLVRLIISALAVGLTEKITPLKFVVTVYLLISNCGIWPNSLFTAGYLLTILVSRLRLVEVTTLYLPIFLALIYDYAKGYIFNNLLFFPLGLIPILCFTIGVAISDNIVSFTPVTILAISILYINQLWLDPNQFINCGYEIAFISAYYAMIKNEN